MRHAISIFIVLLLLSACGANQAQEKQIVKIGVIVPLTGPMAGLGGSERDAVTLALKQLGDTKYDYKAIFEDDQLDPKNTVTAARKLIDADKADALITMFSGAANAIAPIAQENKIIHFSWASDTNAAKGEYNFIHATPPDEEGRVWVDETQKRGIKRIAVMLWQQDGAISMVKGVESHLKEGMSIVNKQIFNVGESDFKTMILKAQESKPDIYLVLAIDPELPLIFKQMRELGINTSFSSIEAFEYSKDLSLFEGEWYANAAQPNNKFIENYNREFKNSPRSGSGNFYDMTNMLVKAYETAGKDSNTKPSNAEAIKELQKIHGFQGALGALDMQDEGTVFSTAIIRVVKDGKPSAIGE